MKFALLALTALIGSSALAAGQSQAGHPCKKAVIRQAKERLASDIIVSNISLKSAEARGEDLSILTLAVSSTTRSGQTKVTELYEAKVDSSCHILALDVVPDSQVVDER